MPTKARAKTRTASRAAIKPKTASKPATARIKAPAKKPAARRAANKPAPRALIKRDPAKPCIVAHGRDSAAIAAGTIVHGRTFARAALIGFPEAGLIPGGDYFVALDSKGAPVAHLAEGLPGPHDFAGFHFAPGGNAAAREGGDEIPAINPHSIWDLNFRPACADPRGMALIGDKFWADIYLLGVDHLIDGTSRIGATIADGDDLPGDPAGKGFKKFDYAAACAVMAHHGKGLLGAEEFFTAAFGVTERTAAKSDPEITGCDDARTSKWGLMQVSGNMWVWGTDGDPDKPRASVFGGAWFNDWSAGSRYANLGDWPDISGGDLGARGRADHLQLV